jgi:hypothetical protein
MNLYFMSNIIIQSVAPRLLVIPLVKYILWIVNYCNVLIQTNSEYTVWMYESMSTLATILYTYNVQYMY